MGRLTVLKQIARDLASQFGPDCEIVIHDLKTNDRNIPLSISKTVMLPEEELVMVLLMQFLM